MFAVIQNGGKQYIVTEGQEVTLELMEVAEGESVTFEALLIAKEDGTDVQVGAPTVGKAKVTAKVLESGLGKKVSIVKYKPKVRYRRHTGHRQPYTKVKIKKISA